jgi:hypothetical protein
MTITDGRRVVHDEGPRPANAGSPLKAMGLLSILTGEAHTTAYTGESGVPGRLDHRVAAERGTRLERDKGWSARVG